MPIELLIHHPRQYLAMDLEDLESLGLEDLELLGLVDLGLLDLHHNMVMLVVLLMEFWKQ